MFRASVISMSNELIKEDNSISFNSFGIGLNVLNDSSKASATFKKISGRLSKFLEDSLNLPSFAIRRAFCVALKF